MFHTKIVRKRGETTFILDEQNINSPHLEVKSKQNVAEWGFCNTKWVKGAGGGGGQNIRE